MPILIERFLLPLLASGIVALVLVNTTGMDGLQRISLGVGTASLAVFLAHSLYKQIQSEKVPPLADTSDPTPSIPSLTPIPSTTLATTATPPSTATPLPVKSPNSEKLENELLDFKVVHASDRLLAMEVWYVYTGSLGVEGIVINPNALADGREIPLRAVPGEVVVINEKAFARMELHYEPNELIKGIKETTEIRLCIVNPAKGVLHCQNFPHEHTWK